VDRKVISSGVNVTLEVDQVMFILNLDIELRVKDHSPVRSLGLLIKSVALVNDDVF
jgi:hypothetical protein